MVSENFGVSDSFDWYGGNFADDADCDDSGDTEVESVDAE